MIEIGLTPLILNHCSLGITLVGGSKEKKLQLGVRKLPTKNSKFSAFPAKSIASKIANLFLQNNSKKVINYREKSVLKIVQSNIH